MLMVTWVLYLLECKNGAFYAGITNDLASRFSAHQAGKGARYTRANPPTKILASRPYPDRSTASVAEAQLKRLPRHKKLDFFECVNHG
jgi:putative endonuclease